jgi:hypothetical protein
MTQIGHLMVLLLGQIRQGVCDRGSISASFVECMCLGGGYHCVLFRWCACACVCVCFVFDAQALCLFQITAAKVL